MIFLCLTVTGFWVAGVLVLFCFLIQDITLTDSFFHSGVVIGNLETTIGYL